MSKTVSHQSHRLRSIALPSVVIAATLVLVSCSSDTKTTDAAPADVTVALATEAGLDTTPAAPATEAPAAAPAAAGTYVLKEWSLEGSAAVKAGANSFKVTNAGQYPHEFRILKGTYEALPKNDLGTVLTKDLPAGSELGLIAKIDPGQTADLAADLPAGPYLFVCNIEFGPNSHAGKGQRLNVTVG